MDDKPIEFYISFEGANGKWWVNSNYDNLEYRLSFNTKEEAYHHSKLAEYEFNLIRLKHIGDKNDS